MISSHLSEETLDSQDLWKGQFLNLRKDKVKLANGKETYREYVLHPGAVMILPILENGDIVMVRQHRYPLHQDFIELPAGKFEKGENWQATGERELLEETGYVAQSWEKLATFYPCIGYSNEKIIFTCAKGLCLVQPNPPKDNELLDVITLPLQESLHMIQTGSISDTKTVSGLLWLATFSLASSSIA